MIDSVIPEQSEEDDYNCLLNILQDRYFVVEGAEAVLKAIQEHKEQADESRKETGRIY